jgi:hypothetical protein
MSDTGTELLDQLEKRFPALTASRSLVLVIGMAGAFGFGFAKLLDNAEESGLEKQNQALAAQVSLYEAKLKVGSPEEALRRFDQLQAMVEQLRPKADRHLEDIQKKDLAAALTPIANLIKPFLVVTTEGTGESARYVQDFADILGTLNINMMGTIGYAMTGDRGVFVGLRDPKQPSDLALKFIDAMRRAGIPVKTAHWTVPISAHWTVPISVQYPLDFDLFIGPPD